MESPNPYQHNREPLIRHNCMQALTGDNVSRWTLETASAGDAGRWAALEIRYNKRNEGFCGWGSKARDIDVKFYQKRQASMADDAFVEQLAGWANQVRS